MPTITSLQLHACTTRLRNYGDVLCANKTNNSNKRLAQKKGVGMCEFVCMYVHDGVYVCA